MGVFFLGLDLFFLEDGQSKAGQGNHDTRMRKSQQQFHTQQKALAIDIIQCRRQQDGAANHTVGIPSSLHYVITCMTSYALTLLVKTVWNDTADG